MAVKHFSARGSPNRSGGGATRTSGQHIRIGFSDLEPIWNAEDDKYKVLCRGIHCSKATICIGYVQLAVSFMFSLFFAYHYVMTIDKDPHSSPAAYANMRYLSQLMLAVTLQIILVVVMIHGVKTERKSFLMPYIVYAAIAVLTGAAGVINDLMYLDKTVVHHGVPSGPARSQLLSHLLGTLIQAWCLSVVWRCYGYLGDKKVARQIREQLHTTAAAFHYPDQMINAAGYALMPQPPPYADTVLSAAASMPPPPMIIGPSSMEKQQLAAALHPSAALDVEPPNAQPAPAEKKEEGGEQQK